MNLRRQTTAFKYFHRIFRQFLHYFAPKGAKAGLAPAGFCSARAVPWFRPRW